MGNSRAIWKHEVDQADKIASHLIDASRIRLGLRTLLFPQFLVHYGHYRRDLNRTRKNLLFTKRMAFDAAKEIQGGESQATQIRLIEIQTKRVLDRERKGYYTEKVRRKQLQEIELLVHHYLRLLNSNGKTHEEMIRSTYEAKQKYLTFLKKLQKAEQEVIKAAITTMRKASKQDRFRWFRKLEDVVTRVRMKEMEKIFPET